MLQVEQNRLFASTLVAIAEQVQQLKQRQPYPWMCEPLQRFENLMSALHEQGDDPTSALIIGDDNEPIDEAMSTGRSDEQPATSPSG